MPTTNEQIGASSLALKYGVPAMSVTYTGVSGTSRTISGFFNGLNTKPDANLKEEMDNDGEVQVIRRTNKRTEFDLSLRVSGASIAAAYAIAEDPPLPGSLLTLGGTIPAALAVASSTIVVKSGAASFSPEAAAEISLSATLYHGKTFVPLTV